MFIFFYRNEKNSNLLSLPRRQKLSVMLPNSKTEKFKENCKSWDFCVKIGDNNSLFSHYLPELFEIFTIRVRKYFQSI